MIAVLSIGNYTLFEQNLWADGELLTALLQLACLSCRRSGISVAGIISPMGVPQKVQHALALPVFISDDGQRFDAEARVITKLYASDQIASGEVGVVIRPGLGWVNALRVQEFCQQFSVSRAQRGVSVTPASFLRHPLWNTLQINDYSLGYGGVRFPVFQDPAGKANEDLHREKIFRLSVTAEDSPRWTGQEARGSHELSTVFFDDMVLHGFRDGSALDEMCIVYHTMSEDKAPMHERLPLFDMEPNQPIDFVDIKKMLALYALHPDTP